MPRHRSAIRENDKYGISWELAAALWDGPRTIDELYDHFMSYHRLVGFYQIAEHHARHDRSDWLETNVNEMLENLVKNGWVIEEDNTFRLTPEGREQASKPIADMRRNRKILTRLAKPSTVSQFSLAIHLGLAAIKLPAGLISGSVGLLNDAVDTLLDGLSSLLVYFGLRFDKERMVNGVLVLVMLVTGGLTLYQAIRRFFLPLEPTVDWFTFLAAIISAVFCGFMGLYQRTIGLRSGSIALITQSVDSRNHVIVSAGVTAGLIASLLNFGLLDTLVGLVVAILILKSAIELSIETIRSLGEDEVDLSHYEMDLYDKFKRFREKNLCDWMLYLVEKRGITTRDELLAQTRKAHDFGNNPMLRELGIERDPHIDEVIEKNLCELKKLGWIEGDERLHLTEPGRQHLNKRMRKGQKRNRSLFSHR